MKPYLISTLALLHIWIATCPGANVRFAGVINDDAGLEISEWRTSTTVKTLDGDGDNLYGSAARLFYTVTFVGQGSAYQFNSSDGQVGPFSGYATVDHPTTGADLQVRTTTNNAVAGPDDVMFTFTALAGSPVNVRVGVVTDGLNGVQYSPASIGLRQVGGGGSSAEHTLTSVNSTLDMVFFDVYGVAVGDQFQVFGDTGSGGFATHQIVTWDAIPPPPGPPVITADPASITLFDGGPTAVTFSVIAVGDAIAYEWFRNDVTTGVTTATYTFNAVPADNGASFHCVVTNISGSDTSEPGILTIIPPNPKTIAYRAAVAAESSRLAYFPFDGDTDPTVTNTVSATNGGTVRSGSQLTGVAPLVGTTALRGTAGLNGDPAWEFPDGSGTVEAFLYQASASAANPCFFSIRSDNTTVRYSLHGASDGTKLLFWNGATVSQWIAPANMIGRLTHVAIVFDAGNVTAYLNGTSLGTVANPLGNDSGSAVQIGSSTLGSAEPWIGTIDELAIYSDALPASSIEAHVSAWFGALPKPEITNLSVSSGSLFMTVPSTLGYNYSLETSPDLASPWAFVVGSRLAGNNDNILFSTPVAGEKSFFRVRVSR